MKAGSHHPAPSGGTPPRAGGEDYNLPPRLSRGGVAAQPPGRCGVQALLALAVTAALAGCALKTPPDPVELRKQALPNLQVPETWATQSALGGSVEEGWLGTFRDPMLNLLVEEALAYNADLRVAGARVEQAAGYATVAAAGMYPAVDLLARGGGKMSGDNSGLQGVALSASWELDVWGRVRYERAAGNTQYASALADLEYARQSLVALVAKSWFLAIEAKMQREVAQESVGSAEKLVSLAKDRERVGRGDAMDVANAEANLETYRDTLRQLEYSYRQSLRALELLLGRYPAAQVEAPGALPPMPPPIPGGLPSELLERRPDVIAAERRVAAAFYRTGEAQAARLPRIALTASVNNISSELFVLQQRDNPVWSLGANLLAPLYRGGALQAQAEIRTAEQKQAVAEYARVALQAFGDVEGALAGEVAFQEREQILLRASTQSDRALGLARVAFEVGSIDLRPVQQQQLALYATRSGLVRVQSEQRVQRVNLYLALGGGFGGRGVDLQDRTQVHTRSGASIVDVYRVVGTGGVEIRPPAGGWPPAVTLRLHGFGTLASLDVTAPAGSMQCLPTSSFFRGDGYACSFGGDSTAAVMSPDYIQIDLPGALLGPDTQRVEVRWSERG
jgi:multidrug efflux system outer membrane protein